MRFQPGHKLARGGKRDGAGRPKKDHAEVEAAATQIAWNYINASVKPVLHTYFQFAHGRLINKYGSLGGDGGTGVVGQEFEADPATTRHFIDKIAPTIDGQTQDKPSAIQVIVEGPAIYNGNGNHAPTPGSRNGRAILIGGE